ncbi:hypothetical protein ABIA16_002537 [Sinorhizobium fredii]
MRKAKVTRQKALEAIGDPPGPSREKVREYLGKK